MSEETDLSEIDSKKSLNSEKRSEPKEKENSQNEWWEEEENESEPKDPKFDFNSKTNSKSEDSKKSNSNKKSDQKEELGEGSNQRDNEKLQISKKPFIYNKSTISKSKPPSAYEEMQIKLFLDIFRSIRVASRQVILPFKEIELIYDEKFLSEKAPLILISEAQKIGFLSPSELAESATLFNRDRILKSHMNFEVLFFRESQSLKLEIFGSVDREEIHNDCQRLAILDSFKILCCLYLETFSYMTCITCQKRKNNGLFLF